MIKVQQSIWRNLVTGVGLCLVLTACPFLMTQNAINQPSPLYFYVGSNPTSANRIGCDEGLQATLSIDNKTFESPLLLIGDSWRSRKIGEFRGHYPNDGEPYLVEAYCYRAGEEPGYIRVASQVFVDTSPHNIYVEAPTTEFIQGYWCHETGLEVVDPIPCVGDQPIQINRDE